MELFAINGAIFCFFFRFNLKKEIDPGTHWLLFIAKLHTMASGAEPI